MEHCCFLLYVVYAHQRRLRVVLEVKIAVVPVPDVTNKNKKVELFVGTKAIIF